MAKISDLFPDGLPKGSVTYKTINGKRYAYFQWSENGKQKGRRVHEDELPLVLEELKRRKETKKGRPSAAFHGYVWLGKSGLKPFVEPVRPYRARACLSDLLRFLDSPSDGRVCVLYGLRRTGKTTLIRQAILSFDEAKMEQTAFLQAHDGMGLRDLYEDLSALDRLGCRYLFIDEVTNVDGFIGGAALLSDVFATKGIKIVLSGTDSLGFAFAGKGELYDRYKAIHTTFIPYREFEGVLGIEGIENYIRYGGTMSKGGIDYNGGASGSVGEYLDSAIASNIQHSLLRYGEEGKYSLLRELAMDHTLTGAINRVVEDMNHRFTAEVLSREFASSDLSLSAKNLLKDKANPTPILYDVDAKRIAAELAKRLEIEVLPKERLSQSHADEIRDYLMALDLVEGVEVLYYNDIANPRIRDVFSQPGIRYAQCMALLDSLSGDEAVENLPAAERNHVFSRIESEIMGRMAEDAILLETKKARPGKRVFKLVFPTGEYDMVVSDKFSATCEIYEIKWNDKAVSAQKRHLEDPELNEKTEFRFGPILKRAVLYRGKSKQDGGVAYVNIEEYLKSL